MRADRLLTLLVLLQSRDSVTARQIAGELGVSLRTVYRDMDSLQEIGVPLVSVSGPHGGYSVLPGYRSVLAGFSSDEISALMTAASETSLKDLGLGNILESAIRKLGAYRREQLAVVNINPEQVMLDGSPWEATGDTAILTDLIEAVGMHREVEVQAESFPLGGETRTVGIQPLGLVHKESSWHLVYRRGGIRVMPVHRIHGVTPAARRFSPPSEFNLKAFWRDWCREVAGGHRVFRVTLAVRRSSLKAVRAFLGGSGPRILNTPTPPENGPVRDESVLTSEFPSFEDARVAVLALGGSVRVVEPLVLRQSVLDFATQTLRANHGL